MPDFPREDPRDAAVEATLALAGIIDLLTVCDEPVQRRGIEYMLRLVHERLEPATESLQDYISRD